MAALSTKGGNWGSLSTANKIFSINDEDSRKVLAIRLDKVRQAFNAKTEVTVQMIEDKKAHDEGRSYLVEAKVAVPRVCAGYDQSIDPAKDCLQDIQENLTTTAKTAEAVGGPAESVGEGTLIAKFEGFTVAQPSGIFDITLSTTILRMFDTKKRTTFSIPVRDILRMFLLPRTEGDTMYLCVSLSPMQPLRVGATLHYNLVFDFDATLVIEESAPWRPEVRTEAELHALFPPGEDGKGCLILPEMKGAVFDIVARVFKTVTQKKCIGTFAGFSSYTTKQCMFPCSLKGSEGTLYFLKEYLVFLHRPATIIAYADIISGFFESSGTFSATITLTLQVKKKVGFVSASSARSNEEKIVLGGIPRKELLGLDDFLIEQKKLNIRNPERPDDDGEEDDDDDDDDASYDDEEDDDDDDSADSDFDDEEGDDEKPRKKHKTEEKKHHKEKKKKHHNEKKEKKHKKHSKHK